MLEHSCARAGAFGCGYKVKAETEDELVKLVAEHAMKKHDVKVVTDTIANYVRAMAKEV